MYNGARLRPGSSRDVEILDELLLMWAKQGLISINPPPGSARPSAGEVSAAKAEIAIDGEASVVEEELEDAEVEETDEDPELEDVMNETKTEDAPEAPVEEEETEAPAEEAQEEAQDEAQEEAPEEDAPAEEAIEDEAPEAPEEELVGEEAPEEAATFNIEEFMSDSVRVLGPKIKDLDPDVFAANRQAMYDYEMDNDGRSSILKMLEA